MNGRAIQEVERHPSCHGLKADSMPGFKASGLGWVLVCLFFLANCSSGPKPLATWQGGSVSEQDYESWLRFTDVLDRPGAVKEMILVDHLAKVAKARGLDQDPAVKMEAGKTRHQIYWGAMRAHVFSSVTVEDQEIQALREKYPDAFQKPLRMRLRNIFLKSSNDSEEMKRTRTHLEEIRAKLVEGADFETLAKQESQSQTRFSGGKLGFLDLEKMPAGVADSVKDLKPGDLSEVVKTGQGFSLFLCEEVREPVKPTAEEVEAKLRTNLTRLRAKEKWERTLQEMRDEVKLPDPLKRAGGFLELPGFRMTEAELDALVAMQMKGIHTSKVPDKPLRALLTNWCVGVQMEKKGKELGFAQNQKVADELRWKPAQVLARYELASRVSPRIEQPASDEVEAFFKNHPDLYQHQPQFQLAFIQFGPEGPDGAAVRQANAVFQKIEGGELTFADAAERFSRHPSAKNGGQLGWVPISGLAAMGPKFVQALRQMAPGELSGVFRLDSGICIFQLLDTRDAWPMTFDEARRRVEADCINLRAKEIETALREEILEGLSIRIHGRASD